MTRTKRSMIESQNGSLHPVAVPEEKKEEEERVIQMIQV